MIDVITIGTATRDMFLTSPFFKIIKDPEHFKKIGFRTDEAECFALGSKIEIDKPIFTVGGGAANAAVTFSRQGLKTAALIRVGDDEFGEKISKKLKQENIVPLAVKDKNKGTAYSIILLMPSGERTILVFRGAAEDLKTSEILFSKLKAPWVYIAPGAIPLKVTQKIVDFFYKQGTLIAMNPSKPYLEMGMERLVPLFKKIKVVILNREEASYLTGIDYQKEKSLFKKFDEVIDGLAIMTEGSKGVLVSDGSKIYSAGIFSAGSRFATAGRVIDRTGAGDAFGSGFVAALIQKFKKGKVVKFKESDIKYAIRLGSANATSVVEKIGAQTGILTKNDFEKSSRWKNLKIRIKRI